jgi:hypothetical protein
MTLEALVERDKIALAADWMELAAILSRRKTASRADLIRSLSVLEDSQHGVVQLEELIDSEHTGEELEEEILQSDSELWASDVREELATRLASIGQAYPFRIDASGMDWLLTYHPEEDRHDHLFYSCCLLITARRYGLLTCEVPQMDRIMQIIAYLVAGRIVDGTAYWFGYPRPDGTGKMAEAIAEVLRRMGFDSPTLAPPLWSLGEENDEGVDLIAWRNFGDGLPARLVVYGQVASGKNWEDKSVVRYTDSTIPIWFGAFGQRYYIPAMFIPWQQYIAIGSSRGRNFRQRVLEMSVKQEKIFGVTIDRGRIAELASHATRTGNDDEDAWVDQLVTWRSSVLASLQAQLCCYLDDLRLPLVRQLVHADAPNNAVGS